MTVFSVPKNLSKANEIFVSLLIPVFSVLVFLLFFETHYVENDDVLMASISSGSYSGKPSEYLVFTNFLIGSLHIYKAKSFPDFCMFLGYILFDILIFIST